MLGERRSVESGKLAEHPRILFQEVSEWAAQRARYMTLETIAALCDDPIVGLPAVVTPGTRSNSDETGCFVGP